MKILVLSQYFYPENFRINDLAIGLKAKGHEIVVLTGMPNYPMGEIFEGYSWPKNRNDTWQGIKVFRVPLYRRRNSRGRHLILNYLSFVVSAILIGPFLLKGQDFDAIFVPNYSPATVGIPGAFFRWTKNAKMVFWVQDLWPKSLSATGTIKHPFLLGLVGKMMRWIYSRSDVIGMQSTAFKSEILAWGAEEKRLRYFPNWAESLFSKELEIEPLLALESDPFETKDFKVVFAGNLGAAQSLKTIVDAAFELSNKPIKWIMIGDGRNASTMKDYIASSGVEQKFEFLGNRPVEHMPYYYERADAMLVTLGPDEIFSATIPGKVQSYMACGKPILGALNGEGARVINESGSGIAVGSEDSIGLATAVEDLRCSSVGQLAKIGENSRACYEEQFDRGKIIDSIETSLMQAVELSK